MRSFNCKHRSAVWDKALKDKPDQTEAAGEETMFEAGGSPLRISSGDVRLVVSVVVRGDDDVVKSTFI